jgi:hypothetical protein
MKFKVTAIHAKKPQFFYVGTDEEKASVKSNIFTEEYDRVANLEIDAETIEEALNKAYKLTNHIDQDWKLNKEVKSYLRERNRSTSVGDVFMVGAGTHYVVAQFGFDKV